MDYDKIMIASLEGKIIIKKEKFIILDVNRVGYKVFLSKKTLSVLPEISETIKLFCFLSVRENAMNLYGFLDYKELEFFEILDNISGIGPKASLEISCLGPIEKIKEKILTQDEKIFEGIPGIGRKKAMKIILELSGKIKEISKKGKIPPKTDEAEEGLVNLGFPRQRAKEALSGLPEEMENIDLRIKKALKILGGN